MKSPIRRPARNQSSRRSPFLQRKPSTAASRPFISNPALQRSPQPAATQAYQKAIHFAIINMPPPPGITWRPPATTDIQIDFNLSSADAQTRQAQVEKHPGDYWKWIFFGAGALADTPLYTEAITYHELVHVVQYIAYWRQYQSAGKTGQSWVDFMRPYNETLYAKGPEEMEAHSTSLPFLERGGLSQKETTALYRGMLVSLVNTYAYTGKSRPAYRKTLKGYTAQVLAYFDKTGQKEAFSKALWWALIDSSSDPAVTKKVVTELKRIAAVAYNLPEFKPFCQSFLREQGLMK